MQETFACDAAGLLQDGRVDRCPAQGRESGQPSRRDELHRRVVEEWVLRNPLGDLVDPVRQHRGRPHDELQREMVR